MMNFWSGFQSNTGSHFIAQATSGSKVLIQPGWTSAVLLMERNGQNVLALFHSNWIWILTLVYYTAQPVNCTLWQESTQPTVTNLAAFWMDNRTVLLPQYLWTLLSTRTSHWDLLSRYGPICLGWQLHFDDVTRTVPCSMLRKLGMACTHRDTVSKPRIPESCRCELQCIAPIQQVRCKMWVACRGEVVEFAVVASQHRGRYFH